VNRLYVSHLSILERKQRNAGIQLITQGERIHNRPHKPSLIFLGITVGKSGVSGSRWLAFSQRFNPRYDFVIPPKKAPNGHVNAFAIDATGAGGVPN